MNSIQTQAHTHTYTFSLPVGPCGQKGICCSCWCHLEIITRPSVAPGHSQRLRSPPHSVGLPRSGNLHAGSEDLATYIWECCGMNPVGIAAGPGCTHREDLTSYSMYAQGLAVHNWNSCRVALLARQARWLYSWQWGTTYSCEGYFTNSSHSKCLATPLCNHSTTVNTASTAALEFRIGFCRWKIIL